MHARSSGRLVKATWKILKTSKATKMMEVQGNQPESCSFKTAVSDVGTDKAGLAGEFDSVLDYPDKLEPLCDTNVPSFAERKRPGSRKLEAPRMQVPIT